MNTALALFARSLRTVLRAVEGEPRPGPYYLPITGGWLPDGAPLNFWQIGMDPIGPGTWNAMVEACISAYSQTVAMLPGDHWRSKANGGRTRITNSALSRILRYPNDYQSISDFMLNLTRSLYLEGNAYALALRNDRFEVASLHMFDPNQCAPQLAYNGEIFYHLAGNDVIERRLAPDARLVVPMRDVLHVRLHAIRRKHPFPLRGETPLTAALAEIATSSAINNQQQQFYMNQARPSAILSTDLVLNREQVAELRQRWQEQARGLDGCGPGGTPILTAGLKVQPWSTPGKDSQIAEMKQMSDDQIALAFRIPLPILGIGGRGTNFSSVEALYQSWIASGLGFCLNHIEEAFGLLFQLKGVPDEYLEFDTAALLRSMFKDRIEGLTRAVQGGIFSPNEARNREDLPDVQFGDEPRVQQQVVPLSAAAGITTPKPPATGPHPPPAPGPGAPPSGAPQPAKELDDVAIARSLFAAADEHDRRVA